MKTHVFWRRALATGHTQYRISQKTGIPISTINQQVRRGVAPYLDDALAIAEAVGVPLGDLAGESKDPGEPPAKTTTATGEARDAVLLGRYDATIEKLRTLKEAEGELVESLSRQLEILCEARDEMTVDRYKVSLPLLGTVAAGPMRQAWETPNEVMHIPARYIQSGHQHEYFLLRVSGDSMHEKGITDGDICLIRKTQSADVGHIVVARDTDTFTLKELSLVDGSYHLAYHDGSGRRIPCTESFVIAGIYVATIANSNEDPSRPDAAVGQIKHVS